MMTIADPGKMQAFSNKFRNIGKCIGFVPTMGALHEGHLKLVREARKCCDVVIVSIFVNPTQFGPTEDFKKYPRNMARDKKLLSREGVDVIFCPSADDMYPEGFKTYIEVKDLGGKLCGRSRPGHFKGVATVVAKLFNIVMPDCAYFGAKDFQQQAIIRRMVKDLNMGVKIETIDTVREPDGLAMSSRNAYLSREDRKQAPVIYQALQFARDLYMSGEESSTVVINLAKKYISENSGFRIDYFSIVDPETLNDMKKVEPPALAAVAAYLGKTRLIDNLLI